MNLKDDDAFAYGTEIIIKPIGDVSVELPAAAPVDILVLENNNGLCLRVHGSYRGAPVVVRVKLGPNGWRIVRDAAAVMFNPPMVIDVLIAEITKAPATPPATPPSPSKPRKPSRLPPRRAPRTRR